MRDDTKATMVAGNMANLHVWRIPGWRIVFFLGSLVAYLVTFIVWKFMMEPSRSQEELSQNRRVTSVEVGTNARPSLYAIVT